MREVHPVVQEAERLCLVVVSDLDPPHEDFPGDVRGWPEPSDEYRAKIIEREIKDISGRVSRTEDSLAKIKDDDEATLKLYWDIRQDSATKDVAKYRGWNDPDFQDYLEESLKGYIARDKADLDKLMEMKP